MEDRIENVDKEILFKFLDKIVNALITGNRSENFSLHREGTYNGMKIKLFTKLKTIIIDSDIRNNKLELYADNYNFATLYGDNSLACKNFLKQIKVEDKKIQTLLSDMLKELESLEKNPTIVKEEKSKKEYWFPKFIKSLMSPRI